jgi:hypothetical protein
LKSILEISDELFTIIFAIEIILKWTALGIRHYFIDGWSWLDFIIVVVSFYYIRPLFNLSLF